MKRGREKARGRGEEGRVRGVGEGEEMGGGEERGRRKENVVFITMECYMVV